MKGKFKNQWQMLLSTERFSLDVSGKSFIFNSSGRQLGRSPFEADIGRVVFSQPFRRLAGKTQVHPFPDIDYVHNRLTHSSEVAYVSRALGRCVASFMLENRGDLDGKEQIEEVGWICQAAGMMHDMGNPPFGHAGEDAIRAWAANRHDDLEKVCEECTINDLLYFDGNAQAFRMASRPDMRESCYFRFTAATLGAMAKYPWPTNSERGMRERKSVAFSTEEKMLTQLLRKLGLNDDQRHPLSYVTEAADDICYRVCDFEDAVLMGLLDETEVKKMLLSGMTSKMQELHGNDSLSKVKALAIGDLIREFAKVYIDNYDAIMSGNFEGKDLKSKIRGTWGEVLQQIKDRYDVIFSEHRKVVSEIGAYGQLSCLLDKYLEFLKFVKRHKVGGLLPEYKDLSFLCQRLVTLAWGGKAYYEINRTQTLDGLLHMIIDFVVGMTDDYLHKVAGEFV